MVALDQDSAVAHQRGLVNMLLATPKSFRNNIGPLIAIVKMYVAITRTLWLVTKISVLCCHLPVSTTCNLFGTVCTLNLFAPRACFEI